MNKKTIYIVVAVIVVVLIVGVAGVMLLNNNGNGGTTTPTATPTPAPSVPVSNATDISFNVEATTGDVAVNYQYTCKGLNAADEKVRIDMTLAEGNYSYIVDLGAQKSWTLNAGAWTETTFADDCTNYVTPFHAVVDKIIANGDTTTDFSYTEGSTTNAVSCIAVNPTIADSVFSVS